MDKCYLLVNILNKIYDDRLKIQRKLRKRNYNLKSVKVFRSFLKYNEYLLLIFFYKKFIKHERIIKPRYTRHFIKNVLKLKCDNIFFREKLINVKLEKFYKDIKDSSFYTTDGRVTLDVVVKDIISKN